MKSLLKVLALFLLLGCFSVGAATVTGSFTNVVGQPDTNVVRIYPVSTPIMANGGFITRGPAVVCIPNTNGIFTTNLLQGNYLATNAFLAQGILFAVPNSTNSYNIGGSPPSGPNGLAISGFNVFNYTPGVFSITSTNGSVIIVPNASGVSGVYDLTVSNAAFNTATNGAISGFFTTSITNSGNIQTATENATGTITAAGFSGPLTGNASTSTLATNAITATNGPSTGFFSSSITNSGNIQTASENVTGTLTAAALVGPLAGNVTGNLTGNAATATLATNAQNSTSATNAYVATNVVYGITITNPIVQMGSNDLTVLASNGVTVLRFQANTNTGLQTLYDYNGNAWLQHSFLQDSLYLYSALGPRIIIDKQAVWLSDPNANIQFAVFTNRVNINTNLNVWQVNVTNTATALQFIGPLAGAATSATNGASNGFFSTGLTNTGNIQTGTENATGTITAAGFSGPLTGNVTGAVTGNSSTATLATNAITATNGPSTGFFSTTITNTGNIATASEQVTNALNTGSITNSGDLRGVTATFTGAVAAGSFNGPLTGNVTGAVTGNSSTATLATNAITATNGPSTGFFSTGLTNTGNIQTGTLNASGTITAPTFAGNATSASAATSATNATTATNLVNNATVTNLTVQMTGAVPAATTAFKVLHQNGQTAFQLDTNNDIFFLDLSGNNIGLNYIPGAPNDTVQILRDASAVVTQDNLNGTLIYDHKNNIKMTVTTNQVIIGTNLIVKGTLATSNNVAINGTATATTFIGNLTGTASLATTATFANQITTNSSSVNQIFWTDGNETNAIYITGKYITISNSAAANSGTVVFNNGNQTNAGTITVGAGQSVNASDGHLILNGQNPSFVSGISVTEGPDTFTGNSGTSGGMLVTDNVQQSGTASFYGLNVTMNVSSTGSGTKDLLELQTGGVMEQNVDQNGNQTNNGVIKASAFYGPIHGNADTASTVTSATYATTATNLIPAATITNTIIYAQGSVGGQSSFQVLQPNGQDAFQVFTNGQIVMNDLSGNPVGVNYSGFPAASENVTLSKDIGNVVFSDRNSTKIYDGSANIKVTVATNAVTIATNTTVQGSLGYQVLVVSKTANYSVVAADSGSYLNNNGAVVATTNTLPAASSGLHYNLAVVAGFNTAFKASGTDTIRSVGTISAGGGLVFSSTIGSTLHLFCPAAGGWWIDSTNGNWTIQ